MHQELVSLYHRNIEVECRNITDFLSYSPISVVSHSNNYNNNVNCFQHLFDGSDGSTSGDIFQEIGDTSSIVLESNNKEYNYSNTSCAITRVKLIKDGNSNQYHLITCDKMCKTA